MPSFWLTYITLYCNDLNVSLDFYHKYLKCKIISARQQNSPRHAIVEGGTCRLILQEHEKTINRFLKGKGSKAMAGTTCKPSRESHRGDVDIDVDINTTKIALSFNCHDVEAIYNHLREEGLQFLDFPQEQPWGGIQVKLLDPDLNVIHLVQV